MVESLNSTSSSGSNLQLPFEQGHELGIGISVTRSSKEIKSSPFIEQKAQVLPPSSPLHGDRIRTIMLKTMSDYSSKLKGEASFSYSGWGPSIQASFNAEHKLTYKANKAMLINSRVFEHGFKTFQGRKDPPLTDKAQALIKKGLDKFSQVYGEYYVWGFTMGSTYWLQVEMSKDQADEMTNYDLSAKGNYMLFSASASGSSQSASKQSSMFTQCRRFMRGHRLDKFDKLSKDIDIASGVKDMINFQEMCEGVEITTYLKPYSSHPDLAMLFEEKKISKALMTKQEALNNKIFEALIILTNLTQTNKDMLDKGHVGFEEMQKRQKKIDYSLDIFRDLAAKELSIEEDQDTINDNYTATQQMEHLLMKEAARQAAKDFEDEKDEDDEDVEDEHIIAIVNKPVTIKCWLGTYLSNEKEGARFANQNRLLWEQLMILPLGSGVYIIKSFRDGNTLGLTERGRGVFNYNSENAPWQWKIEYSQGYYYFVSMFNGNVMHANDQTRECWALNQNRAKWEQMIVEPVSIAPGSTPIQIKPRNL